MTTLKKGLLVGMVQVLLVSMVGAKLMMDRARFPQVWTQTAPYDPNSPLRGRYVTLRAVVQPAGSFVRPDVFHQRGRVEVRGGRLIAIADEDGPVAFNKGTCGGEECLTLSEPLAFFIPENIPDPSIRAEGEQLWVKVTVPPRGAPRPIELGIKEDGRLTPLKA